MRLITFAHDALEPYINKRTMELHHGLHHAAYVAKFNDAVAGTDLEDKSPEAIIRDLDLKRPIYRQTAAYGHFGRPGLPWEELTRFAEFKVALGV